jgi:cysteinyl-tRNA synthetase
VLALVDDGKINEEYLGKFREAMDDDFNGPRAMAVLWELVRDEGAKGKVGAIQKIDEVFGLRLLEKEKIDIPKGVLKLVEKRETARKEKNWKGADELRDEILKMGFVVRDIENGFEIRRIK